MGLADELEKLDALHREGLLDGAEYRQAKQRLLGDGIGASAPALGSTADPVASTDAGSDTGGPRRRTLIVAAAALVLLAIVASGIGVAMTRGGDDIEQRPDADCQELSDDLLAEGRPMSELYPTLRGLGCGEWLDERFQENAAN